LMFIERVSNLKDDSLACKADQLSRHAVCIHHARDEDSDVKLKANGDASPTGDHVLRSPGHYITL